MSDFRRTKDRYVVDTTFGDIYWVVDDSKLNYWTIFYCTDRGNAQTACNYLNSQEAHLDETLKENHKLKEILKKQFTEMLCENCVFANIETKFTRYGPENHYSCEKKCDLSKVHLNRECDEFELTLENF